MTDDILKRLLDAAFTTDGPGPVPASRQLLADAYSEINRLRTEAVQAAAHYARRVDRLDELEGNARNRFAQELDAALALMGTRHALTTGALRREVERLSHRLKREERHRRAVQGLPDHVRLGRALASGSADTRLLNSVVETIAKANRAHTRSLAAARLHPERMTA